MILAVIILLLVLGIVLVFTEILIIPGTTVVGFLGFLFYVIGILFTYDYYGNTIGHSTLAGTLLLSAIFIFIALKSNFWKRFQLDNKLEGTINDLDIGDIATGDTGETLSALRPSGNALIHNEIFEVQSAGEFIDAREQIEVMNVEDNKIIVRKVTKDNNS